MSKRKKKLHIQRETIRNLQFGSGKLNKLASPDLRAAEGGSSAFCVSISISWATVSQTALCGSWRQASRIVSQAVSDTIQSALICPRGPVEPWYDSVNRCASKIW